MRNGYGYYQNYPAQTGDRPHQRWRLLELQGAQICARSDGLGMGSEFSIELRLAAVASELVEPDAVKRNDASLNRQLRILLVDDNIDSAESRSFLLESNGNDPQLAHDGEAAVSVARSFQLGGGTSRSFLFSEISLTSPVVNALVKAAIR